MAIRHVLAINCLQSNDLIQLCEILKDACQDAIKAKVSPYQDPACHIICHQIAFAGNGDLPFMKYYTDSYNFCVEQMQRDQQGLPEKPDGPKPIYQAS